MVTEYPEGSEHFDISDIRSRVVNGIWVRVDGQTWRDPQTNIIYTWTKDRWMQTTELERVKEIIERLRVLGCPVASLEDWVRERGGLDG